MPEQTTTPSPFLDRPRRGKIIVITALVILALITVGSFLYYQNNLGKKAPTTKTEQSKVKVPFTVSGYIGNIDLKNNTLDLITFTSPRKTYKVKISNRTSVLKVGPVPGKTSTQSAVGILNLGLTDLKKDQPIEVTSDEDPAKTTTLTATSIKRLI